MSSAYTIRIGNTHFHDCPDKVCRGDNITFELASERNGRVAHVSVPPGLFGSNGIFRKVTSSNPFTASVHSNASGSHEITGDQGIASCTLDVRVGQSYTIGIGKQEFARIPETIYQCDRINFELSDRAQDATLTLPAGLFGPNGRQVVISRGSSAYSTVSATTGCFTIHANKADEGDPVMTGNLNVGGSDGGDDGKGDDNAR